MEEWDGEKERERERVDERKSEKWNVIPLRILFVSRVQKLRDKQVRINDRDENLEVFLHREREREERKRLID